MINFNFNNLKTKKTINSNISPNANQNYITKSVNANKNNINTPILENNNIQNPNYLYLNILIIID